ncbi:MAG: PaaI family thioesterase [bacterium]
MTLNLWADDRHCFLCGTLNEQGLRLAFEAHDGTLAAAWTAEKRFQGYAEVLHGGIISSILDEVMVNLPWKLHDAPVTTAELTVRFLRPAPIGIELRFTAFVVERGRRLWRLRSECRGGDGTLYAEGSAKAVAISLEPKQG